MVKSIKVWKFVAVGGVLVATFLVGMRSGINAANLGHEIEATESSPIEVRTETEVVTVDRVVEKEVEVEVIPESCLTLAARIGDVVTAVHDISEGEWASSEVANRAKVFLNLSDAAGLSQVSADFRAQRESLLGSYNTIASWEMANQSLIENCQNETN